MQGKKLGGWLTGLTSVDRSTEEYAGQNLGLNRNGPGSLASSLRRIAALFLDWTICYAILAAILGSDSYALSTWVLLLWLLVGVVFVYLFSFTPGQWILGIAVARVDADEKVGLWRAIVRGLILVMVVPALLQDANGRGIHDRATGTALIRLR